MTSSLKLINLAEKATKIGPQFKIIGHRATYFNRPIGLTNFEKKELRISNVDSFKAYTEKILPQMEESIEIRLLRDQYNAIDNPLLKSELLLAYKRRLLTISEMWKPREPFRAPEEAISTPFYEPLDIYLKDIQNVTEMDIGKVIEFPHGDIEKYFALSPLGDYATNQYKYSKRFCLQLTEEAFKLTNEMRKVNAPRLTEEDYKKVFADVETTKDVKRLLDDEELYPRIFHDFAITFLERLEPYRNDTQITKMFTESYLFDTLVNMLVRELISNSLRPLLVNQEKRAKLIDLIIVQLKEKLHPEANPQRIQETLSYIKNFKIPLEGKDKDGKDRQYIILLKKYATSPRALPSIMRTYGIKNFFGFNTGAIVTGMRGTGKSGVLMYAIMWAHKNNWIVVNPPSAYYLTQHRTPIKRHHDSGLYLEYEKARIFLQGFKEGNQDLIKDIAVNLDLYGKYNLAGVHDNEPEPVPVTYDKERKVYSNDWERFLTPNEKLFMQNERREMNVRLKQRLPEPKTLLEIVDHGIKEEMFAVNAIYELLEQLYNLESHRVLMTADDYNYFFLPTCYPSFRYANSKGHESIIPAHHLALSRAFMKFDGHKIKNGVKIVAPGFKKLYKHTFDPSQINMGKGYTVHLTGLPLDDYRTFAEHLKQANIWMVGQVSNISATEKFFLETQGNMLETITGILKPARAYE